MGKKKKDTMELRFYEVPQNEYFLALLGDSWIRDYGHDESNLHFHNLMEIGYCKHGTGELILNEESKPYEPVMVSIIPQNYPHVTISDTDSGPSFWEYLFFDPMVMIQELYPDNPVIQKKILQMVNQKALFFHEWENPGVSVVYHSPSVMEIAEYCRQEKDTLWDETKRLFYPHNVYVDLSDRLYQVKKELLDQMSMDNL